MRVEQLEEHMSGPTHKCPKCQADVPDERLELLGVETCAKCTKQKPRYKGVMAYGHKTGGLLDICDTEDQFRSMKGTADPRPEEKD
jgi:predicted amidophosphoribosyltransferase